MNENLKDILSKLHPDIDQETLLLYLQGKLAAKSQHEVEKQMLDNDFESDALEGLQHYKDKKDIAAIIQHLNTELKKKTEKKRKSRKKLELHLDFWTILTIVLVLTLVFISFILLHNSIHR